MIYFLDTMKKEIETEKKLVCQIESFEEEIYPDVRLTPISEEWEIDNLGNPKSKRIEFSVSRFLTKSEYVENTKQGFEFIEWFYRNSKIQKEILNIPRCKTLVLEIPEQLLLEVRSTFTVILYRRFGNGNH
ncbi:hypothetical protein MWG07_11885 [Fusobacterium necrophorum]|uniref:Uncharacterized protein n=1 Tax=Fusobacterium necrophorum TaxID=859 RepID=A0AAW6WFP7_9FUSO|nr:hypothetical protein [Fusobacterium necrophorum]KYM49452.1 hypothetical protein A2U11_10830 [Fusobacterium necrophorum subsp. funduliforme]MDK4481825.1 hypothetical protein [Fusobacterium necrophorum]MDK4512950.1 hypothetical protein [Fusobacterium necrophorum]